MKKDTLREQMEKILDSHYPEKPKGLKNYSVAIIIEELIKENVKSLSNLQKESK